MRSNRFKKRYGKVNRNPNWRQDRDEQYKKQQESRRAEVERDRTATYLIRAGTDMHVRRLGSKPWVKHRSHKNIDCIGFLWRNESHWGFIYDGYEIKLRVGQFGIPF